MPTFAYKGRNPRGELVQGVIESSDSSAVASQLFNNSITPIEINLAPATQKFMAGGWLDKLTEPKVTTVDVLMFSRQMHTLLRAGSKA